jgi:hypothetical protein
LRLDIRAFCSKTSASPKISLSVATALELSFSIRIDAAHAGCQGD